MMQQERNSPGQTADAMDVASLVRSAATPTVSPDDAARPTWRALWQFCAGRQGQLAVALAVAVLRVAVLLLVSVAIGRVAGGQAGVPAWWVAAAVAGLLLAVLLGGLGQHLVIDAVTASLTRLRLQLVDKLLSLPVDVVSFRGPAHFLLAMTRDCELVSQLARACFGALLPAGLLVLLCLAGLAATLPGLALPLLLALGLLLMARRFSSALLRQRMVQAHQAIDRLYERLAGVLQRHELAVASARQDHERTASHGEIERTHALTGSLARRQWLAAEVDSLVLGLALLGCVAWLTATPGRVQAGGALAVALYLLLLLKGALQTALRAAQDIDQGGPALASICAMLDLPSTPEHAGRVPPSAWQVTLDGVGRSAGPRQLVWNIGMSLAPGRLVVLTGANGAGKTSLVRLLLGLDPPDAGSIRVDGTPLPEIDLAAFRRGVGYLPQNPVLFADTLFNNIAYATDAATPEAVLAMAQALGLGPRLAALPAGLATRLGHGGSPLSGGERQRVALARALLGMPRLVILDEPTNHLDGLSAQALVALLRQLPGRPAVLIISHDAELIAQADTQLTMAGGRLTLRQ